VSSAHFNYSRVANSDTVMFDRIQELQQENDRLIREQEVSVIVSKHRWTFWTTILSAILLVSLLLILVRRLYNITKEVHSTNKSTSSELKELKKTYEAISCVNYKSNSQQSNQQTTVVSGAPQTASKLAVEATDKSVTINFNEQPIIPTLQSRPLTLLKI